jgi:hypothetical protein
MITVGELSEPLGLMAIQQRSHVLGVTSAYQ